MSYVDGFVLAVPTGKKEVFREHAERAGHIFKKHGALQVVEAWGDDVPDGKVTDFRRAVAAEVGETVVFSWITWPNKATRDEGMRKTMEEMQSDPSEMPFDGRRMIFGGFVPVVDL